MDLVVKKESVATQILVCLISGLCQLFRTNHQQFTTINLWLCKMESTVFNY